MPGISGTLIDYHRCCDRLFAGLAEPLERDDWLTAREAFRRYRDSMERLMKMEEEILFPAYERQTGKDQGPTRVLRFDHARLRQLLGELEGALDQGDAEKTASLRSRVSVTLHDHWGKEEQLMFPLADEVLAGEAGKLVEQLRCIGIE
jgi:hemerythrin-like domain-containing protein